MNPLLTALLIVPAVVLIGQAALIAHHLGDLNLAMLKDRDEILKRIKKLEDQ